MPKDFSQAASMIRNAMTEDSGPTLSIEVFGSEEGPVVHVDGDGEYIGIEAERVLSMLLDEVKKGRARVG